MEELKIAKKKNKQLMEELNIEKNINEQLMQELNIEKNINEQLTNNWNKEKLTTAIMVNELNAKINSLQSDINAKITEIINLRNQLNSSNNNNSGLENCKPGERIIVAHFKSIDENVDYPIACKNTDIFLELKKNYIKYSQNIKNIVKHFLLLMVLR